MIRPLDRLRQALARRGLPLTQQRVAIFRALERSREHPSAERIHAELRRAYPSLSLATVYKTLQTLRDLGLANVVNAPHTEARFDAITRVHHHAICQDCGRIEDVFDAGLNRLKAPSLRGFEAVAHSVHFYGVCDGCKRRKGRAAGGRNG